MTDEDKQSLRDVGSQIALMRKKQNITQKELAKRSGLSHAYMVEVENYGANLSLAGILRIARGLGVRLEDLIPRTSAGSSENSLTSEVDHEAKQASDAARRARLTLHSIQKQLDALAKDLEPNLTER